MAEVLSTVVREWRRRVEEVLSTVVREWRRRVEKVLSTVVREWRENKIRSMRRPLSTSEPSDHLQSTLSLKHEHCRKV